MRSLIRSLRRPGGFTLIELLTVMAVIAILAGLVLSISGYATGKGAAARAQTEVQALSLACESFKTDNGAYPHQVLASGGVIQSTNGGIPPSDQLDPRTNGNSQSQNATYANASLELYEALSGDVSLTGTGGGPGVHNYITDFKQDVYGRTYMNQAIASGSNMVQYLSDPYGNCYGYSTANATAVSTGTNNVVGETLPAGVTNPGFNPTFDLWSTGGQVNPPYSGAAGSTQAPGAPGDPMLKWLKNW
jgi:prepilin-type N-terminal cleavage/methylation domain-containing protein